MSASATPRSIRLGLVVVALCLATSTASAVQARAFSFGEGSGSSEARWNGRTFDSAWALRRHLLRRGLPVERVLRANPRLAAALDLRPVRWGKQRFYTERAIRKMLRAQSRSHAHWSHSYPAASATIRHNMRLLLYRPASAPAADRSHDGRERFGMQAGGARIYWRSEAERNGELDGIVASGARWYRLDIYWAMIERSPGNYDWSRHDAVVAAAVARGLEVVGTIAYTPGWARPAGTDDKHPPTDLSAYARFAGEVAKHYAPLGVHHWEIWNEPNIWVFWKPQADAARYAQLLKLAYPAIKSADPAAVVITGGTAPAGGYHNSGDPRNINTLRFLEAIYAGGGGDSFDAVAHHPYSFPFLPRNGHPDIAWSQVANTSPSLRSIMVAHGDGDKQIWGTEFGGTTNGPPGSFVAETTQAEIVAEGYQAWLQYGAWAGPLFVYCYRDPDSTTDTRENFFGLVRFDFSAKPALAAYQSAVHTAAASTSASP